MQTKAKAFTASNVLLDVPPMCLKLAKSLQNCLRDLHPIPSKSWPVVYIILVPKSMRSTFNILWTIVLAKTEIKGLHCSASPFGVHTVALGWSVQSCVAICFPQKGGKLTRAIYRCCWWGRFGISQRVQMELLCKIRFFQTLLHPFAE